MLVICQVSKSPVDTFHISFTSRAEIVEDMDCEMKIFRKGPVFVQGRNRPREKEGDNSNKADYMTIDERYSLTL